MSRAFRHVHRSDAMERAGVRFGARGTQASRTIMLRELDELLAAVPRGEDREGYVEAVVEGNVLGKRTYNNRIATMQRLTELYGVAPGVAVFRVLRHLWRWDREGRPLLAMLCALARDPLLRATASSVLPLSPGEELVRSRFLVALRDAVGDRLNAAVLDKVARNAGSSWVQAGHLEGRVRKVRRRVRPTPHAAAMALWLGDLEGRRGQSLLDSDWAAALDVRGQSMLPLVFEANRMGLIRAHVAGSVVEISARRVDPATRAARWRP